MAEPFVGEIRMFAGNFAPRSWAFCDGQLLAISQNDALFSLLGTIYGGDGRTTFGLPDMRGRIPIHYGSGPGLSPRQIGQKSGTEKETINVNQMPAHTHELKAHPDTADQTELQDQVLASTSAPVDQYGQDPTIVNMATSSVTGTGGSGSHTNLMPFICVHFIIALFGIYPSRN